VHELAEDTLEVGEGVLAVTADLLDEGVDHRTAPAGFLVSDEHPVLSAELGGADGVFGEVVVELDPPVEEAGFKVGQLLDGVAQRFEEPVGRGEATEPDHASPQFAKVVVESSGLEQAGALQALNGWASGGSGRRSMGSIHRCVCC
jgi:hypothetical protein